MNINYNNLDNNTYNNIQILLIMIFISISYIIYVRLIY